MEQSNARPISSDLAGRIATELEVRQNFPTARLARMTAAAHEQIAALAENAETIKAGHKVTMEKAVEVHTAFDNGISQQIADLRERIEELQAERKTRAAAFEQQSAAANHEVAAQLAAIDRMRQAQEALLATLAADVTPQPGETKPAPRAKK